MRYPACYSLFLVAALAPVTAAGQAGLSFERATGLGLKPRAEEPAPAPPLSGFGDAATQAWQALRAGAGDYALYGKLDGPRLGLRAAESYAGVVYSASGWGTSLEAAYTNPPGMAQGRYAITGQMHASLSEGRTLNVGLKYRQYESDPAARSGLPLEMMGTSAYSLAGPQGLAYAQGYQVQMSYHYSASGAVGLALGRDVETFTPFADLAGSGPRQLSFTGQHWLTPSWALSYDVLSHDVASPLKLQGLRLGVHYRW
jgi:hypothetical protein